LVEVFPHLLLDACGRFGDRFVDEFVDGLNILFEGAVLNYVLVSRMDSGVCENPCSVEPGLCVIKQQLGPDC
jgi:hypothetical protein